MLRMTRTMMGEDGLIYRQCRKCQDIFLRTSEFYYMYKRASGFMSFDSVCKICRNRHSGPNKPEVARKWRENHPTYQIEWQRANRDKLKTYWQNYVRKKKLKDRNA